jgi:folate-binding protein YgfZ
MSPDWQNFLNTQGAKIEARRLHGFKENESDSFDNLITDLSQLAHIEVSGDDAEEFLHGQFTISIKELINNHCQFSGWCNAKGQVKETFLIYRNDNDFTILLPAELKESFVNQLQMFVLRANVNISDKSNELVRIGVQIKDDTILSNLINSVPVHIGDVTQGEVIVDNNLYCLRIVSAKDAHRFILIGTINKQIELWKQLAKHVTPVGTSLWELLDLQTAYPWITTQTTQKFLPQMLNLDLIDALNYQKGCYPGQEIIARLHFRGQLKRSLCLTTTTLDSQVISGDQLYADNNEQSIGTVINAQPAHDKYYLLAVIDTDSREKKISLGCPDGPLLSLLQLPYENS